MQCITKIAKESNASPSLQREGHTKTAQLLLLYMLTTHKNSTTITIHANSLFKEGFHLIGLHSNSFSRSLYNTFLSLLFLEVSSSKMSALVIILVKQPSVIPFCMAFTLMYISCLLNSLNSQYLQEAVNHSLLYSTVFCTV